MKIGEGEKRRGNVLMVVVISLETPRNIRFMQLQADAKKENTLFSTRHVVRCRKSSGNSAPTFSIRTRHSDNAARFGPGERRDTALEDCASGRHLTKSDVENALLLARLLQLFGDVDEPHRLRASHEDGGLVNRTLDQDVIFQIGERLVREFQKILHAVLLRPLRELRVLDLCKTVVLP